MFGFTRYSEKPVHYANPKRQAELDNGRPIITPAASLICSIFKCRGNDINPAQPYKPPANITDPSRFHMSRSVKAAYAAFSIASAAVLASYAQNPQYSATVNLAAELSKPVGNLKNITMTITPNGVRYG